MYFPSPESIDESRQQLREHLTERGLRAIKHGTGLVLTAKEVRALFAPGSFRDESTSAAVANTADLAKPRLDEVQIRWLIRRDMPIILNIEQRTFSNPADESFLLELLRQRNCIGLVAEVQHGTRVQVIGYAIYELHKNCLQITRLVVDPDFQRQGVGGQIVQRLKDKLSTQRRREIAVRVCERNLSAQMFFSIHDFHGICDSDEILFRYALKTTAH